MRAWLIAEQVGLYEALTGEQRLPPRVAGEATAGEDPTVVPFRKSGEARG